MSNAEQDTGQNKNSENKTEWDSLATPFDTSEIENPTQDDLSYEAWLKSNANPDTEAEIEGDSDIVTTPFDTSEIENPTQDDLSYEAWLKSNANPDFPTDRDGNPNKHYEGATAEDAVEDATESEDGREYDPTKSRWSQMTEQEKEDLLHKYPRQQGENTNDWGKRIEASEGHRIFGVEAESNQKEEDTTEATAEATTEEATAEATTEETAATEEATASEEAAASEEVAPVETSNETTSESSESDEDNDSEEAAEQSEESAEEVVEQSEESTEEATEEGASTKEAPAVETEASQEDAEKVKEGLLAQLGGGKMAEWVENVKKLTRGQMKEMDVDALQGLIDEYNGGNDGPDGLEGVSDGEDLGGGDKTEGSMAGQAMDMPPAAELSNTNEYTVSAETYNVDTSEVDGIAVERAEDGVESFEDETEKLNSRMDSILSYQEQSGVWEAMSKLLDKCSEGVKNTVDYARKERSVARMKDIIAQHRQELRRMPLFTLPWSEARARKNVLRATIESSVKSLNYYEEELKKAESSLPESLSDEEQGQVDTFGRMDARMDRINADLHTRGYLGDIRMREKWIRDQEQSIANGSDGINAPSVEKRKAFIAKTRLEIAGFQASIDNYQEAHPDFVLRPADGFKNPSYEDIMNGYDNSPDVVLDDEDEDVEDLDAAA